MRVLLISESCSLQEKEADSSLSGRYERYLTRYCGDQVQLAAAYMYDGIHEDKITSGGIVYYAVHADLRVAASEAECNKGKEGLLRVIDDFRPDIIHCFGAEWPYGRIAEYTSVPVVIHMMGFLNIYFLSNDMVCGVTARKPVRRGGIKGFLGAVRRRIRGEVNAKDQGLPPVKDRVTTAKETELKVMSANRYFMGRTEWDKNIVKYYSPGSKYYHVPEAVKPGIYAAAGQWKYHGGDKLRIFSISSADDRKGNEIILRTAQILKELMGLDFEWRVAGGRDFIPRFEERTGISHRDVNISMIGMIGVDRIVEEMTLADLSVHPSVVDNSPHSVCEAQLIGCPVIASNVGGLPQIIRDGVTGWLYPYNEPHTLAFLIGNICRDEELLTRISENEVRETLERHDPERVMRILTDTYKEIIRDHEERAGQSEIP